MASSKTARENHLAIMARNLKAAALLRPGHLARVGGGGIWAVVSTDLTSTDWTVTLSSAEDGHTWKVQAYSVARVVPTQETDGLQFGPTLTSCAESKAVWQMARESYLGPICPHCGAAGTYILDNGQGDHQCTLCEGPEWSDARPQLGHRRDNMNAADMEAYGEQATGPCGRPVSECSPEKCGRGHRCGVQ